MRPYMRNNDLLMFYKYLDKAQNYFEFGSGGSTFQAVNRRNIRSVVSIESDSEWYKKMEKIIGKREYFILNYVDIKSKPKTRGYPGLDCEKSNYGKYSDMIKNCKNIDLLLIDGRFRVACALKSFRNISFRCFLAFDDFLTRPCYKVVLDYYRIIESSEDKCMVIMLKKNVNPPSEELIRKYELIAT